MYAFQLITHFYFIPIPCCSICNANNYSLPVNNVPFVLDTKNTAVRVVCSANEYYLRVELLHIDVHRTLSKWLGTNACNICVLNIIIYRIAVPMSMFI